MEQDSRACSVEGCGRKVVARGLCTTHYQRARAAGDLDAFPRTHRIEPGTHCSVDGCVRDAVSNGYCGMHDQRAKRNAGDPGPAEMIHARWGDAVCVVRGCDRDVLAKGYCVLHYGRVRRGREPGPIVSLKRAPGQGRYRTRQGYIRIRDGKRYRPEHRVVMERVLGRPLRDFESIHHKNGVRDDNRPDNLELWAVPQIPGRRVDDLVAWVVEQYPEMTQATLGRRNQLRLAL